MGRYRKLTLLHSNDMHGDFLAENADENLVGGVSMLSGYVDKVRREEQNTLYCIAGDMFRGSVIDSEFKGLSTIEIMNAIAPDVVTLGNHETDYGIAHLLFLEKCAKFPIINANLYIKSNSARLFRPHIVLETGGMKILFIGIITEGVMKSAKNDTDVGSFVDIHEAAAEIGRICNAYNASDIDLTVLLTHIGFEEDKALAAQLDKDWSVDIIIGGHSHTFIEQPAVINDIVIVQAGIGTDIIGRFDIVVDTAENNIESWQWQTIPINSSTCPKDGDIEKILGIYKQQTDAKYNRIITRLDRKLTHPGRTQETELGGLFADILAQSLGLDIMLVVSGSIRTESMGPLVMYRDLVETFPYDSPVYMLKISGTQLKQMLLYMLRDEVWQGAHSSFSQLSGRLKVIYDIPHSKMTAFEFDGKPIKDDMIFTVGVQQYQYSNFKRIFNADLSEIEKNGKARIVATSITDVLEEYLAVHQHLDHKIDGRLTLIK
ncbi:MAG: bifunctional metallophosphatase/5'-nucleotidase [Oscillospiraceae bacterium]|nr:bifunctional metallophosphatase/5'-nucleotidase [Oscillospiraceae bacterium]